VTPPWQPLRPVRGRDPAGWRPESGRCLDRGARFIPVFPWFPDLHRAGTALALVWARNRGPVRPI